ncbi:MAG TPA: ATP-binding protein [Polyangiaceae bacterium]|nr:ATP-binding protein [Polyangiaceae bacterium]
MIENVWWASVSWGLGAIQLSLPWLLNADSNSIGGTRSRVPNAASVRAGELARPDTHARLGSGSGVGYGLAAPYAMASLGCGIALLPGAASAWGSVLTVSGLLAGVSWAWREQRHAGREREPRRSPGARWFHGLALAAALGQGLVLGLRGSSHVASAGALSLLAGMIALGAAWAGLSRKPGPRQLGMVSAEAEGAPETGLWRVRSSFHHHVFALGTLALGLAVIVIGGVDLARGIGFVASGPAISPMLLPHILAMHGVSGVLQVTLDYRERLGLSQLQAGDLMQQAERLQSVEAELARLQRELSSKQQLAAVGELAAAIAHEVRNPLAVIVNAVSGLRRTDLPSRERGMLLDIVEEEAGRLNRLVTDLLRFARPVNVRRSRVSLADLANRCRATLKDRFDVEVHVADDPSVWTVDVDPNLFRLVFDNLVANACQAMSSGGTVQVQVDPAELNGSPAARIEIRDQGHGMEPQVLERALDPFFTTRPSGTGLGLPIVQRIVDAHGGQLELDSAEGKGTRVILIVPVRAPEAIASEAS